VFDPLAVLLLIAANISMRKPEVVEKTWDNFFKSTPPLEEGEAEEFFEKAKIVAKKLDEDSIEIEKENITQMEEPIVIDASSGESIPPISKVKRGFPNRKSKIDSMYVDDAELAFRKKENE
jgi:hypothetical protein